MIRVLVADESLEEIMWVVAIILALAIIGAVAVLRAVL